MDNNKGKLQQIKETGLKAAWAKIPFGVKMQIFLYGALCLIGLFIILFVIASAFAPILTLFGESSTKGEHADTSENFYDYYQQGDTLTIDENIYEAEKKFYEMLDKSVTFYESSRCGDWKVEKVDKAMLIATLFYNRIVGNMAASGDALKSMETVPHQITAEDYEKASKYLDALIQYEIRRDVYKNGTLWAIKSLEGLNSLDIGWKFFWGQYQFDEEHDALIEKHDINIDGLKDEFGNKIDVFLGCKGDLESIAICSEPLSNSDENQKVICNEDVNEKDQSQYNSEVCEYGTTSGTATPAHWEDNFKYHEVIGAWESSDEKSSSIDSLNPDKYYDENTVYCEGEDDEKICYKCTNICENIGVIDIKKRTDSVYYWNLKQNKFIETYYAEYIDEDWSEEEVAEFVEKTISGIYDFYEIYGSDIGEDLMNDDDFVSSGGLLPSGESIPEDFKSAVSSPTKKCTTTPGYAGHTGTDYNGNLGDPVYAIYDGTVIAVHNSSTGGNECAVKFDPFQCFGYDEDGNYCDVNGTYIKIAHEIGGKKYTSFYGHLNSIMVGNGQSVSKGQQIGTIGSAGCSTGPHLHLGLYDETGGYFGTNNSLGIC